MGLNYLPYVDPIPAPQVETRVIVTYNVTSTSNATKLYDNTNESFSAIEIDDVEQQNLTDTYTFDTTGEHTVKFTLLSNIINSYTFQNCTAITSIIIPNQVIEIEEWVFYGCTGLTSITLSNSLTTIGGHSFSGCTGLTSITIPNSVTYIGESVFEGCSGITSITIPASVTSIGENAFGSCSSLSSITCNAMTAPTLYGELMFTDVQQNGTLIVPTGATGYNSWMLDMYGFLGDYNWTLVQQ